MDDAYAQKLADEIVELEVEEKGPIVRWNWKSKFTPMDISFRWNEETDVFDPILKETTKNVATKTGNVMDILTKSSMGLWHTKITVGHTFMVVVRLCIFLQPVCQHALVINLDFFVPKLFNKFEFFSKLEFLMVP